ncbi:MAG: threonine/serine dehydratase [Candidatus Marinimicrobia bacterium]|jgi:threonine dehydratase|nr:threonine/serine dehydratase [Candidatus Neomarinimicrobiota bacterium]MBT3947474.1 threonine/serine dehydratase [Candidatus Neomarinimicrobiota bacterium]MBT4065248.1 threonine/serine dehydratase [Candidatus Neomarinimicrobiota bacterium]MBT4308558.1 threonine/serine dehydratase [Candidatus Neomarinimicrobiota bacterium]MBT4453703.1 threonine/serine dehydratase [Candidatus Neomarinimicrobiota bacterium]
MISFPKDVGGAHERSKSHLRHTPLEHSPYLSNLIDGDVYLKLDNIQKTGSFKFRGAISKMTALTDEQKSKGVVTASTGNHGAACSLAMSILGIKGKIVVPENVHKNKVENILNLGGEVEYFGNDCINAEERAQEISNTTGATYISPYNDSDIICGQGTMGVEIWNDLATVDSVIISVGGGGLISGVGGYLKSMNENVSMVGVSPQNSCVMYESLKAGVQLDLPSEDTLSDGTAGGVEMGSITFELCQNIIDDFVLISEDEIADGIRMGLEKHHQLIEGAAGAAIAGFMKQKDKLNGQTVVIVMCGGNISSEVLKSIL